MAPKKATSPKNPTRRVAFTLDAPQATEVILMGDFNQWDARKHPMKRGSNGMWQKAVMLAPGQYQYKFLVDGKWRRDPSNERVCTNSFGTMNNVVVVSAKGPAPD
jgi:5'-AMP-activated protein kinase regulatory beta subunit